MNQVANVGADVREEAVAFLWQYNSADSRTDRIYPPDETDWKLVGVRWECVLATGAEADNVFDVTDDAGNTVVTATLDPASRDLGARGSLTPIIVNEGRLIAHGKSGGNAYHVLKYTQSTLTAGAFLFFFYYRKVQPSGRQSAVKES